jgi:hypothetical protein
VGAARPYGQGWSFAKIAAHMDVELEHMRGVWKDIAQMPGVSDAVTALRALSRDQPSAKITLVGNGVVRGPVG